MVQIPPGGGNPSPVSGDSEAQIVNYIQTRLASDPTAANRVTEAYIKFMNEHRHLTPSQGFLAFVFGPVGKALFKDIGIAIGKGGELIGGPIVQGTGAGLDKTGQDLTSNPLGTLVGAITSRETLLRVAEGVLGVLLVAASVFAIINPANKALQTIKKAVK